ncbi:hypothetical protein CAC42_5993 [Sphaceloma murrayae]|uniref:F-box domain-containing protein n=1 Tax=Sphaceloma murrayae TaxID=2082308 RepID=A0A2K1R039_9PEZI|nr:hypothetical protein CAC42_5993 [Sphaceloma murrayae]
MDHDSAVHRLFAIPELLALILSFLPPSDDHYSVDGPTADDHRSQITIERAQSLSDLLHCLLVSHQWHDLITTTRPLQESLFLIRSLPPRHLCPSHPLSAFDSALRSWSVPETAPWLQLNAQILSRGRSPTPPSAPHVPRPRRPQSVSRSYLARHSQIHMVPPETRSASSTRAPASGQMYPARPILNPLLQRHFRNAQFRFNPMHASDSASRYQAHLIVERDDFERWDGTGDGCGGEAGGQGMVPSWCRMQLASPPITSVVAVVWERRSLYVPTPMPVAVGEDTVGVSGDAIDVGEGEDREQRTRRFGVGGWDLSREPRRQTGGRRSFYRSDMTMSAVPPSAFYSTKQVHDEEGLTMGLVMAALGQMFEGDRDLKAVKICTQ